jgi:hypothetical protein
LNRIRQSIRVNGTDVWTLFDSGARNTYIVPAVATHFTTVEFPQPTQTKLAGETKSSSTAALLVGKVEGKRFHAEALVIDRVGVHGGWASHRIALRIPRHAAVRHPAQSRGGEAGPLALLR